MFRLKGIRYMALALAVVMAIGLAGCGGSQQQAAPAKTYEIKIGLVHPQTHSYYKAFEKFKETTEKESKGQIKVGIIHSGQLGGEREMQEMVSLGSIQMSLTGVIVAYEPLFALLEMPYLFRDRDHIAKFHKSGIVSDLQKSLLEKNIRIGAFYENGFRQITNSKRDINSPRDVAGLKIRTPENPAQIETFRQFGAFATPMAMNELYGALQQGVVDGQENPVQNIHANKFWEVQKHIAITNHIYNSGYVIVNNKFYEGLPKELQAIVKKALDESAAYQMKLVADADDSLLKDLEAKGMKVTRPSQDEFRKAAEPVYQVFYAKYGDRAKKIVEGIKAIK